MPLLLLVAACGGGAAPAESPKPPPSAAAAPTYTGYVRGELRGDLATAHTTHDQIGKGSETAARSAGDIGHHVMLATGETGNPKDEFLALDEWTSLETPRAFYADPKFQGSIGQLFAKPVAPELFVRRSDWHTWGDLKPPTAGPYWVMIVKGHLAKATEAENKAAHDAVAGGFEKAARAAGDVAHVPHLAIDDPRVFFNVDVSTNHEGMLATLQNPDFQKAFGALFDAPPEVHIYRSTDWYQW